jgi:Flp pilus assembly protein TadG
MEQVHESKLSQDRKPFTLRLDDRGGVAMMTALVVPTLLGFVGLGTELGLWMYSRQNMQGAADSAALAGAAAVVAGDKTRLTAEAKTVAGRYGLVDATGGVTVTVNNPPASGTLKGDTSAVEVVLSQPQVRLFSALFLSEDVTISARAVAKIGNAGNACVLALDTTASGALSAAGNPNVVLNGCSIAVNSDSASAMTLSGSAKISADSANVVGGISGAAKLTTANGANTGTPATPDPYASTAMPPVGSCDQTKFTAKNKVTLSPGVYCNGVKFNAGADVTLSAGTYIIDGGSFDVAGGASIKGTGVTLVLTNGADATVNGGATIDLTAPTTGSLAGITIFADRALPTSTLLKFNGGSSQNITGVLYAPTASVTYTGGATTGGSTCMQLVARLVDFGGNSSFKQECTGVGTKNIGYLPSKLVE